MNPEKHRPLISSKSVYKFDKVLDKVLYCFPIKK